MEYLPAGVLNNFFRPFLLYWSAKMLNNVMAGNLIGMILDYAIFIGLCVISYELTRKIWPHWFARQSA